MPQWKPCFKSSEVIKKRERPILTKNDVPYDAELIFNAGVAKINGKYVMVFRNDFGITKEQFENSEKKYFTKTSVGVAISDNGVDHWTVRENPIVSYDFTDRANVVNLLGTKDFCQDVLRVYDPRLTVIDGRNYLCLAMDTKHGVRGCIAELSADLGSVELISATVPDNRNMVLFPEKIGGYYYRLERPFPVYSRRKDRFDIWISKSPDLKFWGESELLLGVEHVPFSNDKIGPAAPPIKTKYCWLTLFHAVDKEDEGRGQTEWDKGWKKRYTAGIMLLDLNDPRKIIGMSKKPLIAPELDYEADSGFRQNVIFPGGMILEDNGEVKIYYGAADSVECLATASVEDLVALCTEKR